MNPSDILWVLGSFEGPESLLQRLLFASLEFAVLGLAMAVLIRLGRVRSPRLICLLWLVVLVKPLVSLCVGSPIAIVHLNASLPSASGGGDRATTPGDLDFADEAGGVANADADGDAAAAHAASVSAEPAEPTADPAPSAALEAAEDETYSSYFANTSIADVILSTWLAGMLAFLGAHLVARLRLSRIVRAARPASAPVGSRYRALAAQLRLGRVPRLLVTDSLESPAIVGLLRPTVLLPGWLTTETEGRKLDWAMRHELTHWRWLDPLSVFIRDIAAILFWFHPSVWWAGRRFVEAMELACDRAMVRTPSDATDYAEQLFGILQNLRQRHRPAVAGGLFATRTQVGNRIAALLDSSFARSPQLTALSALGVSVFAGIALAVGVAAPTVVVKDAPNTPTGAERVLHFAQDRSLGMLFTLDAGIQREFEADGFGYTIDQPDMRWEYLGEAKGDVAVPAGKRVRLVLNDKGGNNLSPLSKLGPDDLYELHLGKAAGDKCLRHVARLSGLKVLEFPYPYPDVEKLPLFTAQGLTQLAELTSLEQLRTPSRMTDAGLAAIAGALPQLKVLCLNFNELTDAGLAALPKLRSLEEITIGGGTFTDAGLAHLAELPSLHYVWLWGSPESIADRITDDALRHLRKIPRLRTLKIPLATITDAGIAHLAGHPKLENLWLLDTQVTDEGLVHLKSLPSLKVLNAGKRGFDRKNPPITEAATVQLKEVKSLEHLSLPGDALGDTGLANLAELGHLKRLDLSMASWVNPKDYIKPYTAEGLKALAKVRSLERLSIGGPGVTDAALSHVAQLANLRELHLFGCPITNEGFAKLAALKSLEKLIMMGGSGPYVPQVTVSGLNCLDGLPRLSLLQIGGLTRDDRALNISRLGRLEYLMLSCRKGSAIRDEDLACLANLKQLKWIQVSGFGTQQATTDAGLAHLAGLTAMERLVIGGAGVTDRGLASLTNMHRLDSLNITGSLTDEGLRHLEGLKSLRYLWIYSGNNFDPAAKERLRKSLPNLVFFTADDDRAVGRSAVAAMAAPAVARPAKAAPATARPAMATPGARRPAVTRSTTRPAAGTH